MPGSSAVVEDLAGPSPAGEQRAGSGRSTRVAVAGDDRLLSAVSFMWSSPFRQTLERDGARSSTHDSSRLAPPPRRWRACARRPGGAVCEDVARLGEARAYRSVAPRAPSPRARGGRAARAATSSRMWCSVVSSAQEVAERARPRAMSSTASVSSSTGDAADHVLDHARELVVHDELAAIEGDARLDHPRTVDQVGPCQRCHEAGEGLLVPDLGVTELGVCLQPGDEARQQVAPRHLGHGGADHGELGRAHRRPPPASGPWPSSS